MKKHTKGNFPAHLRSAIFILSVLLLFSGCSSSGRKVTKRITVTTKGIYHTVQKGQTIYRIALAYNIEPKVLLKVNRISDPTKVEAGNKIFVPGAKSQRTVSTYASGGKKKGKSSARSKSKRHGNKKVKIKNSYFMWPVRGTVTSKFGMRKGRPHDGLDIGGKKGSLIRAAASGKVLFSDWGPTGYGNIIIIKHNENLISVYAHNQKNLVRKNKFVKKGEKIALLGDTGRATGPHVHFEIRANRVPVDPQQYLH